MAGDRAGFRYHHGVPSTSASALVQAYLSTLEGASPSTRRQRAWALGELLAHAESQLPGAELLSPEVVTSWIDTAATTEPPASLPGLRARAGAARALALHAERAGAVPAGTWQVLATALRLPAPATVVRTRDDAVRHLLTRAHPDLSPGGVLPAVWARFCAHTHLLALTGAREDVMAHLDLAAVGASSEGPGAERAGTTVTTTDLDGAHRWSLSTPTRVAVTAWLEHRAAVVAALTGGAPTALWVRVRPSSDRRTGRLRPAGLPLSDRGLRLSFTTTLARVALAEAPVRDVTVADVRAHGRRSSGRPSPPPR